MDQHASTTAINFHTLLDQLPGAFLVLLPDDRYTIVAVSDEYVRIAGTTRKALLGRGVFEAFLNQHRGSAIATMHNLLNSLAQVRRTGERRTMPLQRYVLHHEEAPDGNPRKEHWCSPVNVPAFTSSGELEYIIHRLEDATELVRLQAVERAFRARESAAADSGTVTNAVASAPETRASHAPVSDDASRQRRMYEAALSNTPDLVYVFDLQHRFAYCNQALLSMWGKTQEEAIGKTCLELGYEPWHAQMHDREIEKVIATRAPIRGEVPFSGTGGRRVYDYIFVPIIGADGAVEAVAGTTRDITERQEAEYAMREQAQRLRELDRAKDEFLATLSHELRNPLAPLRNAAELLRTVQSDDERLQYARTVILRQVTNMVALLDDLLNVARITQGKLELKRRTVELSSIIETALEAARPLIDAKFHRLDVDLPPVPVLVDADPMRLSQVLANLLLNAAKYTDEGGRIGLSVQAEGAHVQVAVADNGIGLPPGASNRIFNMFAQIDGTAPRGDGGLGIGLALVKGLVELHGGSVLAASEGLGLGSRFVVTLPLASAASAAPAPGIASTQ